MTRTWLHSLALTTAGPIVFLVVWEISSRTGLLNPVFFPPPTAVFGRATLLIGRGLLIEDVWRTVLRLVATALLASVSGITVGFLMASVPLLERGLDGVLAFIYPIPSLLFLPIVSFAFGRADTTIILTAAVTPFVIMSVATLFGTRQIDPSLIEAGRNYGAEGFRFFSRVLLPGALSTIVSALRVALGMSLIGVVAIEMVMGRVGLGAFLWLRWQTLRVTDMYVALLGVAMLALASTSGFDRLSARVLPWKER